MSQLITIAPTGEVFGLVHKQGMPLHLLGKAAINRVSDIQWDTERSMWYIRLLRGPWAGLVVDKALLESYGVHLEPQAPAMMWCGFREQVLIVADYNDAVRVEVALVQAAQLRGENWNESEGGAP